VTVRAVRPSSLRERPGAFTQFAALTRGAKACPDQLSTRRKMIMTLQAGDKLMSLTDVSEMLGIPVHTLYRWRYKGDGPAGYRVGRHVRYRREAVDAWLEQRADKRSSE
jgi:excisionase family DNA binding protein